jgi:hypothetical protein
MKDELDEILDSNRVPNPDNPLHLDAMLALLGGDAQPEDARAVCRQAWRKNWTFRALARLVERAWQNHDDRAYRRLDRFLRRAFGNR